MTTPLFLQRCTEIGISITDLDLLTIGLVLDLWAGKRERQRYLPEGRIVEGP